MISEHSKVFISQSLFHIDLANRAVGVAAYDDSLLGSIDGTPVEVEGSQNARCFGHCFVNSCRVIEMNTLTVCFKKRFVDVFAAIDKIVCAGEAIRSHIGHGRRKRDGSQGSTTSKAIIVYSCYGIRNSDRSQ